MTLFSAGIAKYITVLQDWKKEILQLKKKKKKSEFLLSQDSHDHSPCLAKAQLVQELFFVFQASLVTTTTATTGTKPTGPISESTQLLSGKRRRRKEEEEKETS